MPDRNVAVPALGIARGIVLGLLVAAFYVSALGLGAYCVYLMGRHPTYQAFLFSPLHLLLLLGILFAAAGGVGIVAYVIGKRLLSRPVGDKS